MPATININAVTATTAQFQIANMAADGTLEIQISTTPDFEFCVCPVFTGLARATPVTISALNQSCVYWARVRDRRADGTSPGWSTPVRFKTSLAAAPSYPQGGILIEPALIVVPDPVRIYKNSPYGEVQVAGFPLENLAIDAPNAYRSTSTLAPPYLHVIAWDQGLGASFDTVALLNTNLPEDATARVFSGATASLDPSVNESGLRAFRASANLPGRHGYHCLLRMPAITARYAMLWIESSQRMLHAEHLIVGTARTSKNVSIDKKESPIARTMVQRRRSGAPDRETALPMRKVDFDISALSETQYETLYGDLARHQGKPVLVVPNSKSNAFLHDRILYGDLGGGQVVMQNSNLFSRSFSIDSLI